MLRRTLLSLPLAARAASSALYTRLLTAIEKLEIIDTHEHFPRESNRIKDGVDFFTLAGHYTIDDLRAAGLPDGPLDWAGFEKYWPFVRSTGYGQALAITVRDVYGIPDINARTLPRINEAIASRNTPGVYKSILREKMRVRFAVNDAVVHPEDLELLKPSRRFDHVIAPNDLALAEKVTNTSITNLASLRRGLETHFERATRENMVAVKLALAYQRDLAFHDVSESDASADLDRFLTRKDARPGRQATDYMVHVLLGLAQDYGMPVQIHTGMLAGNRNVIERTRPTQLINVLQKFRRVQFDLFHNGYPYLQEFGVLVKQFPNAYGNFCWTHIISPSAARQALREMLDSVPANKILGFGGDYRYPELSYGHLVLARRNIASVLAERVETGSSTEEQALELARWMLHDNPSRLFHRNSR